MIDSIREMSSLYAKGYVRARQGAQKQGTQSKTAALPEIKRTVTPRGNVVTKYSGTGVTPFSMRWKSAPHSSARLKSRIASLGGKIDRARADSTISEAERSRLVSVYAQEMARASRELSEANARQPVNIIIVSS